GGHQRPAIRKTDVTEYWAAVGGSLRLDVEGPDHLAPLLGVVGDELAEVGGRDDKRRASKVGKPCSHLGIGEARVDLPVELVNDLGRRGLRCADAVPGARLVAWHELSHSWDARQRVRARRGRYGEGAQPASPDILNRCDSAGEVDLHLPAEQVGEYRPGTTIGHVNHVDAGHHLEQLAVQMRPTSDAYRRHADLARIGFGISDEFRDGLGRK